MSLTQLPSGLIAPAGYRPETGVRVSVDELSDAEWDKSFGGLGNLHYEQTAGYTTAQWGDRKSSHIVLRDGGGIVGGARVTLLKLPSVSRGVAWVRFGPIWRPRGTDPDTSAYKSVVQAMIDEYCTRRGLLLSILPRPDPDFGQIEQQALSELGFANRNRYSDWDHYFVNVSLDEDAQRRSLSRHWRRSLKEAHAAGLDIGFCTDEASFKQFEDLHYRMIERKDAKRTGPIHILHKLRAQLPEDALKLVLVSHRGKPVAGAVFAPLGDIAYYILGSTSDEALPLRAGFAKHWWIMQWLSERGVKWYDIGGTAGNKGLEVFKSGLAGREGRVVPVPGEFEFWGRTGDRMISDAVFGLRPLYRKMTGFRRLLG